MRIALVVAIAAAMLLSSEANAKDPKVPPAQDPGLVPVALVGEGVDYTDPKIASRLARDGEGNIVGWDFVDNDIFPYATLPSANADAKLLLGNSGVELTPVRIAAGDFRAVAGAASFVSHTPARTVVVTLTSERNEDWAFFVKATQVFPKLLFVVPAGSAKSEFPAALNLDNVVSIGTATSPGATANFAFEGADSPSRAALLAAAAIATCHAAVAGDGDGTSRKAALLAKFAPAPRSASPPVLPACP